MRTYLLKMSDHRKIIRLSVISGICAISLFIIVLLSIEDLKSPETLPIFLGLLLGLVIGLPILLIIIFKSVARRIEAQINSDGIDTIKLGFIRFEDIKEVQLPINHNGYNSLLILKLENGRKISFAPASGIRSSEDPIYNDFITEFRNKMKNNS
jgi:hypothetical protein